MKFRNIWLVSCTSRRLRQFVAVFIANLAFVANRGLAVWTSPTYTILKSNNSVTGEPITAEENAWLGSEGYVTGFISTPAYAYVNEAFGRKWAGYLTAIPIIIGWIFIIFAKSVIFLHIGRAIQGFSYAGIQAFFALYVAEICEDDIRGAMGAIRGVSLQVGALFILAIGPYLTIPQTAMVSIIFPLLFLVLYFWLPESPMFLLGKGKAEEALNSYKWLRGGDLKLAEEEMKKLEQIVKASSEKFTVKQIISTRETRKALIISVVLVSSICLSGYLAVVSYTSTLLEMSGSIFSPDVDTIILGAISLLGAIVSMLLADSLGRRIIMISTLVVQGLFLIVLGVYLYLEETGAHLDHLRTLPIVCLSVYCFCVTGGLATLTFVIIAEIFRPEARGLSVNVSASLFWLLSFIATKYHHNMEDVMGLYGCYWFYGAMSILAALYLYIELPETKNRTLESIIQTLKGKAIL